MKSVGAMVKQIAGLAGTKDVTPWESDFIGSVVARTRSGEDTRSLSEKQTAVVQRIYKKHFGDVEPA